jgi:prepilin-type N-terminal cleavage/methylation domain-containing protein
MRKLAKVKRKKQKGFTLIELLVVVAIIGILAAIAIPQFAAYRQRGFRSRVVSDVRNAATGMEAYFVDNSTYVGVAGDCSNLPGYSISAGSTLTCGNLSANGYTVTGTNAGAPNYTCTWTSANATPLVCG